MTCLRNIRIPGPYLSGLLMLAASIPAIASDSSIDYQAELKPAPAGKADFQPPGEDAIPAGDFGDMLRYGEQLFTDTQRLRGKYVGNDLNCVNCHLDRGRLADSAPMWAARGGNGKDFHIHPAAEAVSGSVGRQASDWPAWPHGRPSPCGTHPKPLSNPVNRRPPRFFQRFHKSGV